MNQEFYPAFENRYRGSRELIRGRLTVYLPFIKPLLELYQPAVALDLGCGRGEWLELLRDNNFQPYGVDLDGGMLAACTERGLPVTHGDAIAYLKSLGDDSQCIVSGFHIAEHIAFDDLETLVSQSLRVLKPGGLLILETPNPENVVVGTSSFYLDPTHQRPIPPPLLSFLAEHLGFARVHTVRLQEQYDIHENSNISLMDVLDGVSPDYSVVAQKAAAPAILANFDVPFATHYGIELHELAARYDGKLDRRMSLMDQRLVNVETQTSGMVEALGQSTALQNRFIEIGTQLFAHTQTEVERLQEMAACKTLTIQLVEIMAEVKRLQGEAARNLQNKESETHMQEQHIHALEAQLQQHQAQIDELSGNSHYWKQQACALEAECTALRQCVSWRITAPLRGIGRGIVRLRESKNDRQSLEPSAPSAIHRLTVLLLNKGVGYAQSSPHFRRLVLWGLERMPGLAVKLRQMHMAYQLKQVSAINRWAGQSNFERPVYVDRQTSNQFIFEDIPLASNGINSSQKTPLEANFSAYRGNE